MMDALPSRRRNTWVDRDRLLRLALRHIRYVNKASCLLTRWRDGDTRFVNVAGRIMIIKSLFRRGVPAATTGLLLFVQLKKVSPSPIGDLVNIFGI